MESEESQEEIFRDALVPVGGEEELRLDNSVAFRFLKDGEQPLRRV